MQIFLFLGSRRGHAVLKKLIAMQASISGILCLIEDAHEDQYHPLITAIAKQHHIPIFYSNEVKPNQYADIVKKCEPDLSIAIGWRFMINQETATIPAKGTLITHDSLLPKYRGFAPTNWAIINGETETGVTLFYIAAEVDSGPIIDQLKTPIAINDTLQTVDEHVIALYEKIIEKNLPLLAAGTVKATPQNEALATFCCKRIPEDGLINWQLSAVQIHHLIRGTSQPCPGAFSFLRGQKIILWSAQIADDSRHFVGSIPGRLIGKRHGMIEVLTGNGILQIKTLQREGEKIIDAKDFSISVKDTFQAGPE